VTTPSTSDGRLPLPHDLAVPKPSQPDEAERRLGWSLRGRTHVPVTSTASDPGLLLDEERAASTLAETVATARAILDQDGDRARAGRPASWYWDLASGWLEWDEGLKAHFGHGEKLTDAAWREDRIHPEDRARVQTSLQRATIANLGAVWSAEYRFRRADGTYAAVAERAYVIHDAAGPRGVVGAILPVSVVAEATGSPIKEAS